MNVEIATKNDIEQVKTEILEALKEALSQVSTTNRKWLKGKEVMEMLGISLSGLQNFRINGVLPYSKLSGIIYYRLSDIERILSQNLRNNNINNQDPQNSN